MKKRQFGFDDFDGDLYDGGLYGGGLDFFGSGAGGASPQTASEGVSPEVAADGDETGELYFSLFSIFLDSRLILLSPDTLASPVDGQEVEPGKLYSFLFDFLSSLIVELMRFGSFP